MKQLQTYRPGLSLMDFFYDFDFPKTRQTNYNLVENESSYVVELIAPGFKKEDFSVSLEKNELVIAAKRKDESNDVKYHSRSYVAESFRKSFHLNSEIKQDEITANYENGILYINIPKNSAMKLVKQIEVM